MQLPVLDGTGPVDRVHVEELESIVAGEVRFDRHHRQLYSTDASMYQVEPLGVVVPACVDDIAATLRWCHSHDLPVLPRGGGTSLSGQTVNHAVVVDCSSRLRSMSRIDVEHLCVDVEPGVVLDDLRAHAARAGLMFGPEVSTSSHATIAGMISNCSAGLHSRRWGMTDRHVRGVDLVLADGTTVRLERGAALQGDRVAELSRRVADIVMPLSDEIDARFPRLRRNVAGYALDRVLASIRSGDAGTLDGMDLATLVCGSEGTLGFIAGATVSLLPAPRCTTLVTLAFPDVSAALSVLTTILKTDPSAVELLDDSVLRVAQAHPTYGALTRLLPGVDGVDHPAVLYVDWHADDPDELVQAVRDLQRRLPGVAMRHHEDAQEQHDAWLLRKVGLGLILSGDQGGQPVGGLEDCAVPPEALHDFQREFDALLGAHGLSAIYYAHASVGLLHIRPKLDLEQASHRALLEQLGSEANELVRRYGGTPSGEHGDGRVRAAMMHEFYGPRIVDAFRAIKEVFDPRGLFNPGIITSDPGTTAHLRGEAAQAPATPETVETFFDWSSSGGLDRAAARCNGNGLCRRMDSGAMCPSWRATRDERHATRGRANALRMAITGHITPGTAQWNDPDTHETLALCLGCKACRYECPAGVDVASLRSEYLAQHFASSGGPPWRTRFKRDVRWFNRIGSALHPVSTALVRAGPLAWLLKRVMGVAASRTLPAFGPSLLRWAKGRGRTTSDGPVVLLMADCFTTWSEPSVGRDAVELLEAFGYRVEVVDAGCCGRTSISAGDLAYARDTINRTASRLDAVWNRSDAVGIVALEPSCATAMQQEWCELRLEDQASRVAHHVRTIEQFIVDRWEDHPTQPAFEKRSVAVPVHQHCHQKHRSAVVERFLRRCGWPEAQVLDSGCCGMAGSFGYDQDTDEISRTIARQSLGMLCDHGGEVAATGTSCRHQIDDVFGLEAVHPVTLARRAMP